MSSELAAYTPETLPLTGVSRWEQLKNIIPVSRETWRKLVKAGKAPKPHRLSAHCVLYNNEEIHRWMKDPSNYRPRYNIT